MCVCISRICLIHCPLTLCITIHHLILRIDPTTLETIGTDDMNVGKHTNLSYPTLPDPALPILLHLILFNFFSFHLSCLVVYYFFSFHLSHVILSYDRIIQQSFLSETKILRFKCCFCDVTYRNVVDNTLLSSSSSFVILHKSTHNFHP